MTQEGIIQKVFKTVLKKYSWKKDGRIFNDSYYDIAVKDITKSLEQELIKEIEKHAFFTACDISLNVVELDKLIGETKE